MILNQESLKNVLLIFAKLNAGIRYVQGMNEILAPLFFVFRSDPDDKNAVWSKRLFYYILFLVTELFLWFSHDYLYHDVATLESLQKFAEADSFFCFVELLGGFRDNFCQKLDNSAVGIQGTLAKLSQLVAKYDAELQHHLEITTEVSLYMLHIGLAVFCIVLCLSFWVTKMY